MFIIFKVRKHLLGSEKYQEEFSYNLSTHYITLTATLHNQLKNESRFLQQSLKVTRMRSNLVCENTELLAKCAGSLFRHSQHVLLCWSGVSQRPRPSLWSVCPSRFTVGEEHPVGPSMSVCNVFHCLAATMTCNATMHLAFPWLSCWRHYPWCGIKNVFGSLVYSKAYIRISNLVLALWLKEFMQRVLIAVCSLLYHWAPIFPQVSSAIKLMICIPEVLVSKLSYRTVSSDRFPRSESFSEHSVIISPLVLSIHFSQLSSSNIQNRW